jgi:hypothetical protein
VRVVFRFCDVRLQREGGRRIPNEGSRRFDVEVRNEGTAACRRVRLGVASGGRLAVAGGSYTLRAGRGASDAIAVAAPAGAKLGSRLRVVLSAAADRDVDTSNNLATVRPVVVGVGDSRIRAAGSRRFAGSASGSPSDLSRRARRVAHVDVAVRRLGGKRCNWLASAVRRTFARRSCSRPVWLRATGRRAWRLQLRGALPAGRYVAFSRATIGAGFHEASFTARDGNRVGFRVG